MTYDINGFKWSDEKWIGERRSTAPYDKPMLIYEMHLGSWKRHEDGSFYTYRETADELVDYLCEMNYTHVAGATRLRDILRRQAVTENRRILCISLINAIAAA